MLPVSHPPIGRAVGALSILFFICGNQAEQIAVGFGLQRFRAGVEFAQTCGSKDA